MTAIQAFRNFDGHLLIAIQHLLVHDGLTPFVKAVTTLGNKGFIWIALALLMLFFPKTRKAGSVALLALVISYTFNNLILKELFARTRPYDVFDGVQRLIAKPGDFSFPSGHAANSFAAATAMALCLPKKYGGLLIALAALIALSRLYLGVHYPSDVLFGGFSGAAMGYIAFRIDGRRRKNEKAARSRKRKK